MGPVSPRKADTDWRDINRLFGLWAAHNLSYVDPCSPGPKSLWLFVDVVYRVPEECVCDQWQWGLFCCITGLTLNLLVILTLWFLLEPLKKDLFLFF